MPWYASMPMCGVGLKGLRVCVSAQPRSSAASTSPHSQRSVPPPHLPSHHLWQCAPMRTVMIVVGFPLAAAAPAEHPSSRSCKAERIACPRRPRTDPSTPLLVKGRIFARMQIPNRRVVTLRVWRGCWKRTAA